MGFLSIVELLFGAIANIFFAVVFSGSLAHVVIGVLNRITGDEISGHGEKRLFVAISSPAFLYFTWAIFTKWSFIGAETELHFMRFLNI